LLCNKELERFLAQAMVLRRHFVVRMRYYAGTKDDCEIYGRKEIRYKGRDGYADSKGKHTLGGHTILVALLREYAQQVKDI
jgi:hypothetical protein